MKVHGEVKNSAVFKQKIRLIPSYANFFALGSKGNLFQSVLKFFLLHSVQKTRILSMKNLRNFAPVCTFNWLKNYAIIFSFKNLTQLNLDLIEKIFDSFSKKAFKLTSILLKKFSALSIPLY
jgi:hypothetical protein